MFQMGGGKRAAAEPKPKAPKKPALVTVTVKLEPRHRQKLELLGGEAWLREQIERAKLASPFDLD